MDWRTSWSAAAALLLVSMTANAAESVGAYKVDASFLNDKHPTHLKDPALALNSNLHAAGVAAVRQAMRSAKKGSGLPGIDSVVNFTGSFTNSSAGFPAGTWPWAMVGNAPNHGGNGHTAISAPIIPVTVELLDANGNQAYDTSNPNAPPVALILSPDSHVQDLLQSPMYANTRFSSSNKPTQYNDAVFRAQFFGEIGPAWHTNLVPSVKTGRVMQVPFGAYHYALNKDGTCCRFFLVDANTFTSLLFPPVYPVDNSTVIGAAELAGDMTTQTIATLFFQDTFLYQGDLSNCCILGFHEFDSEPGVTSGANPRLYVMNYGSWISPGIFRNSSFADITALSHEMAEIFSDPFVVFDGVHNATPWWYSGGNCQNNLEVGDVIEGLPAGVTYPVTMPNGFTYHPQNEALLSWFAFQSPSSAIGGAYSYPDPTSLPALSPTVQPVFDGQGNFLGCQLAP